MGLFDGDAPDYHEPAMDAGGRRAIDTVVQGARNSTPENMQAAYQPPSAQGLLKEDGGFNQGLAYQNPMSAAIQQRTMGKFQHEERKLNVEVKNAARNSYFDRLAKATDLAHQEQQANFDKEMAKRKAKEAKKAARGQAIGSILGIVGGVAGGVFGGPVGGAAGAQAGGAIGQNIGQGM